MERTKSLSPHIDLADKEAFWKEHSRRQKESGLSGRAYCKANQLNYRQFSYWSAKSSPKVKLPELLPVTIEAKTVVNSESTTLGTVVFKSGYELRIHEQSLLPMLFSLMS